MLKRADPTPGIENFLAFALVTLLALPASALAAKALRFSVNASLVTDDNVNKAPVGDDVREDTFVGVLGGASFVQILGLNSSLIYRASVGIEEYQEFDGLSNASFSFAVDYKFRFVRGFTAPGFTLTASLNEQDFDSDMRDATTFGLLAVADKRFTDRLATAAGLGFKTSESESDVFDNDSLRVFANVDLVLSERALAYTTLNLVSGDVVSTSSPTVDIIAAADAIEADDAFGGRDTGQFAYRLDADTTLLTLGLNYGINQDHSLDASVEFLDSSADGGIDYERTTFRLTYLGVF